MKLLGPHSIILHEGTAYSTRYLDEEQRMPGKSSRWSLAWEVRRAYSVEKSPLENWRGCFAFLWVVVRGTGAACEMRRPLESDMHSAMCEESSSHLWTMGIERPK